MKLSSSTEHNQTALSVEGKHGAAERVIRLEGAVNFRDLGGYPTEDGRSVKRGKLYRSAELSGLTATDLVRLETLGLTWICDLRSDDELRISPSPAIGRAVNEQLSLLASVNPQEMLGNRELSIGLLAEMNRQMVRNTEATAAYIRKLLQYEGAPTLFHCAAGKDRTGFVAAVVLQALGVPRTYILEDYAMTNQFAEQFRKQMSAKADAHAALLSKLPLEAIEALTMAHPSYLTAAFEEIDTYYGGFEGYWLNGLGLERGQLERMRELYVE